MQKKVKRMTQIVTGYSKIKRPDVSDISPRLRLFELIESVNRPLIWISAPGGSGKSTLAASYLSFFNHSNIWYSMDSGDEDPATFFHYMKAAADLSLPASFPLLSVKSSESIQYGLASSIKFFFQNLYSHCLECLSVKNNGTVSGNTFYIVLDNYQDIPSEAAINDMLASGLSLIPNGIKVIVISRDAEPPPSFSEIVKKKAIHFIGWKEIRFTLDESRAIITPEMQKDLIDRILKDAHEKSQGWAAGMILAIERTGVRNSGIESMKVRDSENIFDSFADEVFSRTDRRTADFLLKTAFFPIVTVEMAEKMTGMKNSERILSALNSHHFFTERLFSTEKGYKYHPLFRAFLLKKVKERFRPHEVCVIKKEAAAILETHGHIDDSARLFFDANDFDGLSRLINNHGKSLLIQGRNKTLEEWTDFIPLEMADSDPWIFYWKGMCAFPHNMDETRIHLEKAFDSFKLKGNSTGFFLSWAGLVDSYVFDLDSWKNLDKYIDSLDLILRDYPEMPSTDVDLTISSRMLIALTLRKTDSPEWVNSWYERVSSLLRLKPSPDIQMDTFFFMSVYYLWIGEYNKNEILFERAEAEIARNNPPPFSVIRIKLMMGIHFWITARYDGAVKILSEGLLVSEKHGIHDFDSLLWGFMFSAELARGRKELAGEFLRKQLESLIDMTKTLDVFFYHINSAWNAIISRNPSLAAENLGAISVKVKEIGNPYYTALWNIGMAHTLFLTGHYGDAKKHLRLSLEISRNMRSNVMEWYSLLIEAYFLIFENNEGKGISKLKQALSIGRKNGYVHLEFYQPYMMQILCSKAIKEGLENNYVTELIEKLALTPPGFAIHFDEWPWPIKIFTLGRFEIVKNGQPLVYSGKEPKKPIEMLKTIIALGGKNVPEGQITDTLWPDTPGDLAFKSFETTLGRLRKVLGGNHFVRYNANQISLDESCWVDSFAVSHIHSEIKKTGSARVIELCDKSLSLYCGDFLPSDTSNHWAVSRRETIKNYQMQAVISAGSTSEDAECFEKAADYYLKGLGIDDLSEKMYQRLMICYLKLGRQTEAVRVYGRCKNVLMNSLGLTPSPETSGIFSSILQKTSGQ